MIILVNIRVKSCATQAHKDKINNNGFFLADTTALITRWGHLLAIEKPLILIVSSYA